jgi:hypothetical protein
MTGTARQRILRTMRRALVLAAVFVLALLAAGLTVGAGSGAASALVEEEKDVIFSLKAEGFTVEVIGEDNDGEQTASMYISHRGLAKGGLLANYNVPATLTDHSLAAKFGSLGEMNFEFTPRKCHGGLLFTGSFTFTGENHYVQIDADRATGSFVEQAYTACGPLGPIDFSKVRQISSRVHLEATAASAGHGAKRRVEAFDSRADGGHRSVQISAFISEEREGMTLGRGAIVDARPAAFRWNRKAGTATLRPPAPFTGSATLKPGRGGKGIWEGSLRVPVFGGEEPVTLAGPAFHARLRKEYPTEE